MLEFPQVTFLSQIESILILDKVQLVKPSLGFQNSDSVIQIPPHWFPKYFSPYLSQDIVLTTSGRTNLYKITRMFHSLFLQYINQNSTLATVMHVMLQFCEISSLRMFEKRILCHFSGAN